MTAAELEREIGASNVDGGINVRWIMPEGMFEFPVDAEDLDETAERLVELARTVMPEASFEMQLEWALMVAAHYDSFIEAGVQYSGFVITDVEGARCTATVTVCLSDLDESAGLRPVGFIGSAMRHLDIGQVSEIELPCGPAVSCIGTRKADLDGSLTLSGQGEPVWTSFIQVQVPLGNGTLLTLEMSTPNREGWDVFSSMFAGVVKSVRFFDDAGNPMVMPG
ncbi:hypothetical protein EF913_04355 [Streptomyces sp. WAC04189]|uniref:hypothetical protein n=1 Tax=Streptomyces sp. WAC04189 TaxID=2487411 RepID=UPI000F95AE04|nr:hypothetical protein [Streptomyces sp. WAC04189]RSS06362.1 hypothetical protein EF913_04355 [Streptomyces sp. WAC04189]